jgi:eukaryotic-like serine/threonine-protein kinase
LATPLSSKRRPFWRADWFVGVIVVAAVLLLHKSTAFLDTFENRFYDLAISSANKVPSDQIAIVAIDDQSMANLGRWPWSREVQAKLIDQINAGAPKSIVNTVFYFEPQVERGLPYLRQIRDAISSNPTASNATLEAVHKIATEGEAALSSDASLAQSIAASSKVLLAASVIPGEPRGKPDKPLGAGLIQSLVKAPAALRGLEAAGVLEPLPELSNKAAAIGHVTKVADSDGTIRVEPLLVNYYGQYLPSIALMAAIKSLNLHPADVLVNTENHEVQIGKLKIGTDEQDQALMRPFFYNDRDGKSAFAVDSAFDVLSGKIPVAKYANKIVLIGPTAAGLGVSFPTPLGKAMTPVELTAHVTSSILSEHFVSTPLWASVASQLAVLLVAVYLILLLPRLSAGPGAGLTALLFAALLIAGFVLLSRNSTWLQLIFPATLLLVGHLTLTTKRFLVTEASKLRSDEESAETNRMMGLALQGQGQLDMAFDRFRRVPVSDALMENLGNLSLDFERKRQFNKAQAVYEHMAHLDKTHQGLDAKLRRAKNLSETVMLGSSAARSGNTVLLTGEGVEKPMLGRYQVEKELGKGAMGVVYLGKDPKIGRVVAIKTLALSQEFDGEALTDARARFFREAETAGRLQHQNIVTIFDAGEEHDLAFIAMEFLKGKDLLEFCNPKSLLPVATVLSIVERVAQALAYAHRQNVVHRDIKPANIMYEPQSDTVKVTDFGIARITDSSRTRTGLVLGTPSFMSPEQIAGKKVDGRSDLYSLGVMLFQMLCGTLPFRGDSMAQLMYKIANEEAPDIRVYLQDANARLAHALMRSLSKYPEARFQDGDQLAAEIRLVMAELVVHSPSPSNNIDGFSATQIMSRPSTNFDKTVVSGLRNSGTDS